MDQKTGCCYVAAGVVHQEVVMLEMRPNPLGIVKSNQSFFYQIIKYRRKMEQTPKELIKFIPLQLLKPH